MLTETCDKIQNETNPYKKRKKRNIDREEFFLKRWNISLIFFFSVIIVFTCEMKFKNEMKNGNEVEVFTAWYLILDVYSKQ